MTYTGPPSKHFAQALPPQHTDTNYVAAAAAAAGGAAAAAAGEAAFSDCGDAGGLKKLCCRAVTALMRLSGSYAIICRNSSTCAATNFVSMILQVQLCTCLQDALRSMA